MLFKKYVWIEKIWLKFKVFDEKSTVLGNDNSLERQIVVFMVRFTMRNGLISKTLLPSTDTRHATII